MILRLRALWPADARERLESPDPVTRNPLLALWRTDVVVALYQHEATNKAFPGTGPVTNVPARRPSRVTHSLVDLS